MKPLPGETLEYLRAGRALKYDEASSGIGAITLHHVDAVQLTTLNVYPGCQEIMFGPYDDLDGVYEVQVYSLVSKSAVYRPEGLLCWIPALARFGSVDDEHGSVLVYSRSTWSDIVENPVGHLNAQWGRGTAQTEYVLPWLHFPFRLDSGVVFLPYPKECPIHHSPVSALSARKGEWFEAMRQRALDDWLANYLVVFPCSGVPADEEHLLCCAECRTAEIKWLQAVDDENEVLDVTPNAERWVKCPGCGIHFALYDPDAYLDSRHRGCGQKLRVVDRTAGQ
jgi:hypothetical protein